jgi:hypothetical protein
VAADHDGGAWGQGLVRDLAEESLLTTLHRRGFTAADIDTTRFPGLLCAMEGCSDLRLPGRLVCLQHVPEFGATS